MAKEGKQKGGRGFARITSLPEDQKMVIDNWLTRGGEVMALTRQIQQDWKQFTDVAESSLYMQLNRYRSYLHATAKESLPSMVNSEGALIVKAQRNRNIDPMERLVALVEIQEKRLQMFLNKEAQVQMPIAGVEKVIDSTKELLKDIQKIRFDTGLDEFKGVVQGMQVRAGSKTITAPDGTSTTTQLFEAISVAEKVLERASIVHAPGEFNGS